jgi:septal ring factor EnvC (AmiA/AmiB activator)
MNSKREKESEREREREKKERKKERKKEKKRNTIEVPNKTLKDHCGDKGSLNYNN